MRSRGSVAVIAPEASVCFTVSCARIAAIAAPASDAADTVRRIRSSLTIGRAASWMTTISARSETRANALATDARRESPPLTTLTGLPRCCRYDGGADTRSAGSATTISEITSQATKASTLRARIGRPPSVNSCLGEAPPKRRPRPPAAMMAETNKESGVRNQASGLSRLPLDPINNQDVEWSAPLFKLQAKALDGAKRGHTGRFYLRVDTTAT